LTFLDKCLYDALNEMQSIVLGDCSEVQRIEIFRLLLEGYELSRYTRNKKINSSICPSTSSHHPLQKAIINTSYISKSLKNSRFINLSASK
jgi:hypothetical protein